MKKILEDRLVSDLVNYIKSVVELKPNNTLRFENYKIGLTDFEFDDEIVYEEDGHFFYANASAEVFELTEMPVEDLLALARDVYFQNL